MTQIRLQVMICTFGDKGLDRLVEMSLPKVDGVGYLVSCQSAPYAIPQPLVRDDIKVVFTPTMGLSNNRNNALAHVEAEYALIADDDLTYYADALPQVIKVFDAHPEIDFATFRCDYPYAVTYPPTEHDLSRPYKNYNITSFEIALRISSIRKAGVGFSPLLGIGAPYLQAAEESIFVCSCLKYGLKGRFFPITIAKHPTLTTGFREVSRAPVVRANGAYIAIAYPFTAVIRIPLTAYRTQGNFLRNLYHLAWGAVYGLCHRRSLLEPKL